VKENLVSRIRLIDRDERKIEIERGQVILTYPLNAIPDILYQALADIAEKHMDTDSGLEFLYRSTVQKPTFVTFNSMNPFPLNCAPKVVRLTYQDEIIRTTIDELEGRILSLQGRDFKDTIEERIQIYRELYSDDSKIDRMRLGAIEIYGASTYQNILRDPRVTLGFSWYNPDESPREIGFQINCVAEIVIPGDPFYEYMEVMRTLFSQHYLNLGGRQYKCAYKLWVSEIKQKSLDDRSGFIPSS
jgi:hypothetical protein